MCARTTCRSCGKPTVSGCGQHVEQALRGIPKSERCQGHARTAPAQAAAPQRSSGFLSRLFGGE
jgi:hypothetical protein